VYPFASIRRIFRKRRFLRYGLTEISGSFHRTL
jgi:hypothetical protein